MEVRLLTIDVIVPVYNGAKYIERCINSVLENRNHCPKRLMVKLTVINDGSTDETLTRITRMKLDKEFVTIITQQNSGVSMARNRGIEKTSGDYILFLDADDWLPPNTIHRMAVAAKKNSADIVIGKSRYYLGNIPLSATAETGCCLRTGIIDPRTNGFLSSTTPGIRAKIFSRELFRELRFPEERIKWEDLALVPALIAAAKHVCYIDKVVYNYGVHMNTTMKDFFFRCDVLDIIKSLDILKDNLQITGTYYDYFYEYYSMMVLHVLYRAENIITWINVGYHNKKILMKRLLQELEAYYPDWKNDPIITDEDRRPKDPIAKVLFKIIL